MSGTPWTKTFAAVAITAALLVGTTACSDTEPKQAASVVTVDEAAASSDALTLLDSLPIKGRAPKTGYDRTEVFGSAWKDVNQNSCPTRDDILAASLTNAQTSNGCQVETGTLHDPYTGKTIKFKRGVDTSSLIQIDHVIALSNAWQTGAQQLTQERREALANDPINLMAVDGRTNSAKGDGDAATWLPPLKSYRCTYVSKQIDVKAAYDLWVTQAEHDAMARILSNCTTATAEESVVEEHVVEAPVVEAPAVEAPAVEAPATTIHPGSFCADQGATGVADNGKTYTCGKKPADAAGRFHWNA